MCRYTHTPRRRWLTLILKIYPVRYGISTTAVHHPLHPHSHTKAETAASAGAGAGADAGTGATGMVSLQDLAWDADDARPPMALLLLFVC